MNGLINKRVLMLNQNYEPLTICSARRAIVLLFQGKVEMLAPADGLKLRTVTDQYSLPSVVRLWHYKKVPMKRIMLTRKNVLLRDNNQCQYCGTTRGDMTVDHVIPKTMGGTDTWNNLVCSCSRCASLRSIPFSAYGRPSPPLCLVRKAPRWLHGSPAYAPGG